MELAEHLKEHRVRLGFTQEEVADRIYVSRQTLSNWETGKTYPDIHSLLLLSNLYSVSLDELVKGDLEAMDTKIKTDATTLKNLSWVMLICIVLALVFVALAIVLRDIGPLTEYGMSVGCCIAFAAAGISFLGAFAAAVWAEVLKRQNDVVTFKEITAFEKGIPFDEMKNQDALGRKHPALSVVLKAGSGAIFGLVALFIFVIIGKYIRDFVFMLLG